MAIAINPTDSQTVFASSQNGGLFKSKNGGASWAMVNLGVSYSGSPITDAYGIAIDHNNSNVMYLGLYTGGILKSTDAGLTWTAASNGLPDSDTIYQITTDPNSSQVVYAFGVHGFFKSIDAGATWVAAGNGITGSDLLFSGILIDPSNSQIIYCMTSDGVFKSIDGSASWVNISSGITAVYFENFTIDPTNSQIVYIGTYNGIYKSYNSGASWSAVNDGLLSNHVSLLAVSPANSQTIYADTEAGLHKSVDGGASWIRLHDRPSSSQAIIPSNNDCIVFDPNNSNTIYSGTAFNGIFKTLNGDLSWSTVNSGTTLSDVQSLAMDPANSSTLYATNYNDGIYKTSDSGKTWSQIFSAPVASIIVDPTRSQTVYAGTVVNGIYKSADGGGSWSSINSGLAPGGSYYYLAIDPTNSQILYAGAYNNGIFRSTNGGQSWTAINNGLGAFIAGSYVLSIAVDPANNQNIYAGTSINGILKSSDGGMSWTQLNQATPQNGTIYDIRSIVIDPANSQVIYIATYNGVYKSYDGGASWSPCNNGIFPNSTGYFAIYSLAIDPASSQTIYAGSNTYGLFKSTNGGASWNQFFNPKMYRVVNSIAIDPTNSQSIFLATSEGVYKTNFNGNGPAITGSTGQTLSEGTPGLFKVIASGWPVPGFSISGDLPNGLAFDPAAGVISGTPASGSAGTYQLVVTASNGVPPDAVRGFTLSVLPSSSLAATISSPTRGSGLSSLPAITGTASGSGLSAVQLQITDGTYYLQTDGTFALTPTWLTSTGTTSWSFDTSKVAWREGITYTLTAQASNGTTTSLPATSTCTIQVPASKTGTILSIALSPSFLRAGNSTTITGSLAQTATSSVSGQSVTVIITPPSTAAVANPSQIVLTVTTDSNGNFGTGALSTFAVPGAYLIQARFEGTPLWAASFASQTLGVTPQSGYAIIVVGEASDHSLLAEHTATADGIYATLVNKRGFLPANVLYLKSTASAALSKQQVQAAVSQLKASYAAAPAPFYLFLVDHGSQNGFVLGDTTQASTLGRASSPRG